MEARCRQLASASGTSARHRPRRYGGGDGAQRARAARGTARCRARRGAQSAQRAAGPATIAFCLRHGEAQRLVTDAEFAPVVKAAPERRQLARLLVVDIDDPEGPTGERPAPATRTCSRGDPGSGGPAPSTSGTRSRSSTRRAPPAIRKGRRVTIAARTWNALGNALVPPLRPTACTCGRCRCSTCCGWTLHVGGHRRRGDARVPAARRSRRDLSGDPRSSRHAPVRRAIVLNLLIHAPDA